MVRCPYGGEDVCVTLAEWTIGLSYFNSTIDSRIKEKTSCHFPCGFTDPHSLFSSRLFFRLRTFFFAIFFYNECSTLFFFFFGGKKIPFELGINVKASHRILWWLRPIWTVRWSPPFDKCRDLLLSGRILLTNRISKASKYCDGRFEHGR